VEPPSLTSSASSSSLDDMPLLLLELLLPLSSSMLANRAATSALRSESLKREPEMEPRGVALPLLRPLPLPSPCEPRLSELRGEPRNDDGRRTNDDSRLNGNPDRN
jgi:hypothetical protein